MSKLEFTRYLYIKDEVILSFVNSILKKKNINEAYFWFSELYYSKYNVSEILLKIYYDFYYLDNIHFEKYLFKKIFSKEDDKLLNYLSIIKNLFNLSISCNVFLHRQSYLNKSDLKVTFKGRSPKWIKNIHKDYHLILRCLDKGNMACFYSNLKKLNKEQLEEFINQLKIYNPNLNIEINSYHFKYDISHILMAYLTRFNNKMEFPEKKKLFVLANNNEIDQVKNTNIPIPPRNFTDSKNNTHKINQIRKTLDLKRDYSIDKDIVCFDFVRRYIDNKCLLDKYYYNWEYYAYNCDLWKKRMDNYQVTFDVNKTCNNQHEFNFICFPNDDLIEDFYEKYGYETDEQTKEVTEKSLINIHGHEINPNIWLKKIFDYNDYSKDYILHF
jgi:hypothetical protein